MTENDKFISHSSPPIRFLNVTQLNEQIYELLKGDILSGKLASGERLSVDGLANSLGISPTPIRDAIRNLSVEGLVQVSPRRGSYVAEFSRTTVNEIFQVRRIIECAAADTLASASDELARAMRSIVTEMGSLVDGEAFNDYPRYIVLDAQFHTTVVGQLRNRRLSDFYEKLRWPVQVLLTLSESKYQRASSTMAEHLAIVEAFEAKDAHKARQNLTDHLNKAESDLLRHMPPEGT